MPRVKRGVTTKRRHKKVLKMAKGYRNIRRTSFRRANEAVMKAGLHAYRDRRKKKRTMRALWILRINAGVRPHGMSYSRFINALKQKDVQIDRKILAGLAAEHPDTFKAVVETVK